MAIDERISLLLARNILVGDGDVVKIADFGLAKFLHDGRLLVDRGVFDSFSGSRAHLALR
jgi:serine/threonine protein kinase